jgi:hypothetical protein
MRENEPNKCDNKQFLVIVTHIWQKLSSVEREVRRIVKNYWQLFSYIFGETLLIVTHIWRNLTCKIKICNLYKAHQCTSGHNRYCR